MLVLVLLELTTARNGCKVVATLLPLLSQNVRGWQGPLWVTQPSPLPKQGHPEQAAQHCVQAGLEYLQRRRLHNNCHIMSQEHHDKVAVLSDMSL